MALYNTADGCQKGSVMVNTPFGSYCQNQGIGAQAFSVAPKNPVKGNNIDSIISGAGGAVSDIICAFKGGCQNSPDTVVYQTEKKEQEAKKSNTTLIVLSLLLGIPLVVFLIFFILKLAKGK